MPGRSSRRGLSGLDGGCPLGRLLPANSFLTTAGGACVCAHGPHRLAVCLVQRLRNRKMSLFLSHQTGPSTSMWQAQPAPSPGPVAAWTVTSYLDRESRRARQEGRDRGNWGALRGGTGVFLTMR